MKEIISESVNSNPLGNLIVFVLSQSKHCSIKYSIDLLIAFTFLISFGSFKFNFLPERQLYFCTILSLSPFFKGNELASISNLSMSLFFSRSIISFSLHILSNSGMIFIFVSSFDFSFFSTNFILLISITSFELLSKIIISSLFLLSLSCSLLSLSSFSSSSSIEKLLLSFSK